MPPDVRVLLDDGPRHDQQVLFGCRSVASPAGVAAAGVAAPVGPAAATAPDLLAQVRYNLTRLKNPDSRALIAKVLRGEPFAAPGARDSTLQQAASIVAFVSPAGAGPEVLGELFRPSIDAMAAEADNPNNPALTMDDVVDKLSRALEDAAEKRAADQNILKVLGADGAAKSVPHPPGAATADGGRAPEADAEDSGGAATIAEYTEADVERFAKSQGVTVEEFRRRWIIQNSGAYYVFVDGAYRPPVPKDGLMLKLRDDFAAGASISLTLLAQKADGGVRVKTVAEVTRHYGTYARQSKGSFTIPESRYDKPTDTFWEALARKRDIRPTFNPEIDTWLRLLGGTDTEKLLDWLATLTDLDRQSCALYLSGKKNAGKTMLAHGAAQIWTEGGPTALGDVLGNFNEGIARCPLLFGDEKVTCPTEDLRSLVGSSAHTLKRKYMNNVPIVGALRIILADNGGKMLLGEGDMSGDDLDAVASKFLHLMIDDRPAKYLAQLGGRTATNEWVSGDGIAAHILWLKKNRAVVPGSRFLVEGNAARMYRLLTLQSPTHAGILEFLARFLEKPVAKLVQDKTLVVGNGRFLVNAGALREFWTHYVGAKNPPSTTRIGDALRDLSQGKERIGNLWFYIVRYDWILAWAEDSQVGDRAAMEKKINGPAASGYQWAAGTPPVVPPASGSDAAPPAATPTAVVPDAASPANDVRSEIAKLWDRERPAGAP